MPSAAPAPPPPMRSLRLQQTGVTDEASRFGHYGDEPGRHPPGSSTLSPSPDSQPGFQYNASLHSLDTSAISHGPASPDMSTPITGLRLQTDHLAHKNRQDARSNGSGPIPETSQQTIFNAGLPVRSSSIRSSHTARKHRAESLSPGSAASSPGIGPLVDMTPLPSPISLWGSPSHPRRSIDEEMGDATPGAQDARITPESASTAVDLPQTSPKKRKIPIIAKQESNQQAQIHQANFAAHTKNRSLSDYVPDGIQAPKTRNVAVSTSIPAPVGTQLSSPDETLHREQYLAVQRGIATARPPTPPDSIRGTYSDELKRPTSSLLNNTSSLLCYEAKLVRSGKVKRWRGLRKLGEGQFSTVILATSQVDDVDMAIDPVQAEADFDPKSLVAVKICNHGPAGGADEKSLETSIKRELDLMKSIRHPSLVHLKAVCNQDRQTLFVLNYCPGGDLFELASTKLDLLQPSLVRRIVAELVAAVRYLHLQYMVHRDIKLENILVNLRTDAISGISDWQSYNRPVVTLSDLGLGRDIPKPPESPLLRRRCGSEDYAAPEVLIGQDYDGRSTDAWALGVVLYTLMEGRMPFDPIPGSRRRSPTSHKIARCEWQWVKWADADGEWDPVKGKDLEGAREIVEGLLARTRSRWTLEKVQKMGWVAGGIQVEGGVQLEDEED